VRNNPWTRFFNGVTCHQNRIGRSLPVGNLAQPVSIPQGERSAAHSFLEGDKVDERALKNLVRAAIGYNQTKLKKNVAGARAKVQRSKKT
jgi:hypothetical protein